MDGGQRNAQRAKAQQAGLARDKAPGAATSGTTKAAGDDAEARALDHLTRQGLRLVQRNYRVAGGPHARGAEIDLILRDADDTLVFVEVRARRSAGHGSAAASIGAVKQRRIVLAARHYLRRFATLPACRFDVVTFDGERVAWLKAAFDAP